MTDSKSDKSLMIKIEFDKGIPVPKVKANRKYSFEGMEIGDSFVGNANDANALHLWCKLNGWQFTRRAIEGETGKWRFWRIA